MVCQETYTVTHSTRLDSYLNLQESPAVFKIRTVTYLASASMFINYLPIKYSKSQWKLGWSIRFEVLIAVLLDVTLSLVECTG
jgi:hypothetical protein